jgi:uncharacterized protein YggE
MADGFLRTANCDLSTSSRSSRAKSRGEWRTAFVACGALLLVGGGTHAQTANTAEPPVIVVSGEGLVKAAPDQAFVRIGAETRSKVSRDAQAQNAAAMSAVQQRLAAAGISKEAIRTASFDLQLEFDYNNGRQTPRGFVARNTIDVRVDDLARVSEVLDAATASGATMIHGLRFDLKNRSALEREALQRAVADGLARAEAAASGARRSVDRVVRIEEAGVKGGPLPPQPMMAMRATVEAAPPTPVAAGEIEIRAQVNVTVAIK